ncbi:hypothetical protein [Thalassotalea agariperforans]
MPNDALKGSSAKVPSQIFRWFEKMKSNYESSVNTVLQRFELFSEKQQHRLDSANKAHIEQLMASHQQQLAHKDELIAKLDDELNFFKQQVEKQQETHAQLNARYDAIIGCLLNDKRDELKVRDIFNDDEVTTVDVEESKTAFNEKLTNNEKLSGACELFQQAISHRENKAFTQAFVLFEQAAKQLNAKAMGALGRAYFLAEGVEENQTLGLAWLINAADLGLPQAVKRVEQLKAADPFLYNQAVVLAKDL